MAKAKQIQAHKRDKCNKANNTDQLTEEQELSETPDSGTDTNLNNNQMVENRRRQYQGYFDQKEDREREEETVYNTKDNKQETSQTYQTEVNNVDVEKNKDETTYYHDGKDEDYTQSDRPKTKRKE
eukprot:4158042-Heterocapsa_arctica.AAC.1